MTLVKYNPFRPARTVSFDNLFDNFFSRNLSDVIGSEVTIGTPSVNVIENDDSFVIEVAAPGLSKDDFNIDLDNDRLVISAEKETNSENSDNENYTRREFNYTSFSRGFHISEIIDRNNIQASYDNGVLKINLGKKEEAITKAPRTIEIK